MHLHGGEQEENGKATATHAGRQRVALGGDSHPLGHELHKSGIKEHDAKVKRAEFIGKSVEVRETFQFASPVEVLQALKVYCSSFYGSMLWDLAGNGASQVFNAWNMAIKLTWDCPRETRNYLVQQVLSCGMTSARLDIMSRYAKFFKGLRTSTSREVATLANLMGRDVQTTTGKNIRLIEERSGLSVWSTGQEKLKEAIAENEIVTVDEADKWRIPLLQKQELSYLGADLDETNDLINSLCIN